MPQENFKEETLGTKSVYNWYSPIKHGEIISLKDKLQCV